MSDMFTMPDHQTAGSAPQARVRRIPVAGVLTASALILASLALAAPEQALGFAEPNDYADAGNCQYCHMGSIWPTPWDQDCDQCHGDEDIDINLLSPENGYEENNFQGPHGGYTTGTSKCDNCHSVHDSPADSVLLLPSATIVGTCFTCHDGTAGWSVYGTLKARTGSDPGGGHSFEQTSVIPGGDGATGGVASRTFNGPDGTLICTDCHSAHGSNTVAAFRGDRRRLRCSTPSITHNRLLRQQPTGATTSVAKYGSDWCAACHNGRTSGGMVMNHPVDSSAETSAPFDYGNVAVLSSDDPTGITIMSTLGGILDTRYGGTLEWHDWPADTDPPGNRGYLMPYPRTPQQSGHYPICQQCHEDSRSVGTLVGDGSIGDAEAATIWSGDGVQWSSGSATWTARPSDNPYLQNFPHETVNAYMLVENDDDLCTNCHPMGQLP